MANYFDKVRYLYPGIQRISYWHSQYDGTPWENPYDGLVWENGDIAKPTQSQLDNLDDAIVEAEMIRRDEVVRKEQRDMTAKKDLTIMSNYKALSDSGNKISLTEYLDSVETFAKTI